MRIANSLIAIVAIASTGCVGELRMPEGPDDQAEQTNPEPAPEPDPEPAPTGATAREVFDNSVAGIFIGKCDNCHGGAAPVVENLAFLGGDTSQVDLVYTSMAGMVGVHNQFSPTSLLVENEGHSPPYDYSDLELASIIEWMELERSERGLLEVQGDPLAEWAGCMELGAWNSTEVHRLANEEVNNNNNNRCYNCHNDMQWGVGMASDDTTMFNQNRTEMGIRSLFTVDNELGIVVPNHEKLMLYSMGGPIGYNHPRYDYAPDTNDYQRLEEFYMRTMERKNAGSCGPAEYYVP